MELAQRLSTCKQCEKRKFNPNTGIVCSLTLRKPDFENDCSDFVIDPKEVAKKYGRLYATDEKAKSGNSMPILGAVAIAFFVIRIVMRIIRD